MNNNIKKIFTIFVLGVFILSLGMSFVSADPADPAVESPVAEFFKGVFVSWGDGETFNPIFAKILFWLIITLIIYSVADLIPGLDGEKMGFVRWVLAVVVGFLSVTYITPNEIYTMMVSYSAMGFVLGGFLPIIVLAFFTWSIASKSSKNPHQFAVMRLLTWFMWLGYTLFSLMKVLGPLDITSGYENGSLWMSWLFVAFGVVMLIFNKKVFMFLKSEVSESEVTSFKDNRKRRREVISADIEDFKDTAT